ncbi:hypothetical protein J6590_033009 [Homalodisca vitripennis]|nr:hypothetical protein J6590_033009 [Homalodisca vitripennis]
MGVCANAGHMWPWTPQWRWALAVLYGMSQLFWRYQMQARAARCRGKEIKTMRCSLRQDGDLLTLLTIYVFRYALES